MDTSCVVSLAHIELTDSLLPEMRVAIFTVLILFPLSDAGQLPFRQLSSRARRVVQVRPVTWGSRAHRASFPGANPGRRSSAA